MKNQNRYAPGRMPGGGFMQYIAVILGIFGLDFGIKDYIEKNKSENTEEKKLSETPDYWK